MPPAANSGAPQAANARREVFAPIIEGSVATRFANASSIAEELPARDEVLPARANAAVVVPVNAASFDDRQVTDLVAGPTEAASPIPQTGYAGLLAAGALASCVGDDWRQRVHAALADAGPQTMSKLSRLSRRLRRPPAHESGARLNRRRHGRSDS